ncbi:MAG: BMP family ABC transporter substrate-binding protein [Bowdeniella nasicola]|nr:BMP family ABC transporter substrate-binding protein [Bowdeniella nasicola]
MRKSVIVSTLAATAMVLSACGQAPEAKPSASSTESGGSTASGAHSDVKACMVSDEGGFDDKSFNQSGHEGLLRAEKELGVQIKTAESHQDSDFEPNLNNMVAEGCNIIIGVGFKMADQLEAKAKENPNVKFALVDSTFKENPDNARALVFNTAEAAYLAGYAAAGMSKTGAVGTFLGMKIPTTAIFADGFEDGVKKYNEDFGKSVKVLGWDKASQNGQATGDFSDVAKGQSTAKTLIDQGADVIMPVAGPVGAGALAAAKAAGDGKVSVVWVDADGYETQKDSGSLILTSVVKEIGAAVFDTIKSVAEDKFSSEQYVGTLENGGVSIADFHDFDSKVPQELKDGLNKVKEDIISGTIKIETQNQP